MLPDLVCLIRGYFWFSQQARILIFSGTAWPIITNRMTVYSRRMTPEPFAMPCLQSLRYSWSHRPEEVNNEKRWNNPEP